MKNFAVNIVQGLTIGLDSFRVGVVSYSGWSKVNFLLDEYTTRRDLVDAIRRIPYIGDSTNTAAAIEDMRTKVFTQRGDRPNVPNIAILITDGESNIEEWKTIPNARKAKNDGIIMLVVGITDDINRGELEGISSNGVLGDSYWLSPGFEVEQDILRHILGKTTTILGRTL